MIHAPDALRGDDSSFGDCDVLKAETEMGDNAGGTLDQSEFVKIS
jgi:hypothetical protein